MADSKLADEAGRSPHEHRESELQGASGRCLSTSSASVAESSVRKVNEVGTITGQLAFSQLILKMFESFKFFAISVLCITVKFS